PILLFSLLAVSPHLTSFPTRRSSDLFLLDGVPGQDRHSRRDRDRLLDRLDVVELHDRGDLDVVRAERAVDRLADRQPRVERDERDRKSTRLNSSHGSISYAVFCLNKK